jgi:hypothetical protein
MSTDTSPTAQNAPEDDDRTVHVSNKCYNELDVSVLLDDGPNGVDLGRERVYDIGRVIDSDFLNGVNIAQVDLLPTLDTVIEKSKSKNSNVGTAVRAMIDTGAFATCTDQLGYLHGYTPFSRQNPCPVKLLPAMDGVDAIPKGYGYLHIPCNQMSGGYLPIRAFYHPALRTTVIDERDLLKASGLHTKDYTTELLTKNYDVGTWTYRCDHRLRCSRDIILSGPLVFGKAFTSALIPCDKELNGHTSPSKSMDTDFGLQCRNTTFPVNSIKAATERMIWHQRLGHPSDYYLYHAHQFVDGVPQFKHHDPVLERCPTCIQAKQRKEPAGPNSTMTATENYQGLSIDFSFSGTRSKDKSRSRDYVGMNGETCYLLVVDHHSGCYHGVTRISKACPINWLSDFLDDHATPAPDKYVYLDQGGELYHNPKVRQLFARHKYQVRPTGAGSSNQNGPVDGRILMWPTPSEPCYMGRRFHPSFGHMHFNIIFVSRTLHPHEGEKNHPLR